MAVNPYRRYPIYTPRVVNMYRGKRRTEMPPHVFAVSDGAYSDMLNSKYFFFLFSDRCISDLCNLFLFQIEKTSLCLSRKLLMLVLLGA